MNSFTFHEPRQHGTLDFPCAYYYIDQSHPRYNMAFHWHKEWELIRVLEGSFTIHADDHVFTAHSGDILLIRDGMLHGGTPENCVYECFLFDLHGLFRNSEAVKKHLRPIYRHKLLPEIYYPARKRELVDSVVTTLLMPYFLDRNADSKEMPVELIVFGGISQLFATILQMGYYTANHTAVSGNTYKIDRIKSVLEYIEMNYASQNITLEELAGVAGLNSKYFCRFFRSITHQTPMDYVNMYRIEKAAQMLYSTELPVTDICMECGFNDSSNFIKVFRKYKGMTPKQYRKG